MDIAFIIMKYGYLALLWGFVISVVALIRRDIFTVNKPAFAHSAPNQALPTPAAPAPVLSQSMVNPVPNQSGACALANLAAAPAPAMNYSAPVNTNLAPVGILVVNGIAEGDYYDLSAGDIIIGRNSGNLISLNDSFVSGKHARIFTQNGKLFIEDLRSTNGTNVDGNKIKGIVSLELGSKISIGNNVLELV